MIFQGAQAEQVSLRVTGFEFPRNTENQFDASWLKVHLQVNCRHGDWQAEAPVLTTHELQELIDWFGQLGRGTNPEPQLLKFTEPNLSFEMIGASVDQPRRVRIHFDQEFCPEEFPEEDIYFVDIPVDQMYAEHLADQLSSVFPQS